LNLLIDVGNTETVVGVCHDGSDTIEASWRITTTVRRTSDELRLVLVGLLRSDGIEMERIDRAVIGSVVPGITDLLPRALSRAGIERVFIVENRTPLPIRLEVDEPRTVGPDRVVNTLAASHLFGRDTLVVDLGTANTFDLITGDGAFRGGVIAPGLGAGHEWLSKRTAKLPTVEFRRPERVIGRRTESCLESGIFFSAIDAIDGIVRRMKEEWEGDPLHVVATGGYAGLVAESSETIVEVVPHLTLLGLEIAGRHMAKTGHDQLP
jgi:type III pantothenate kinase